MLDETMSGEPMALKFINKINGKLKFIYWKNRYPRILCNTDSRFLIMRVQPGTLISIKKKTKKKIQIMQNKCIRFCLKLEKNVSYI